MENLYCLLYREYEEANKRVLDYIKKNGGRVYVVKETRRCDFDWLSRIDYVEIIEVEIKSFDRIDNNIWEDICLETKESCFIKTLSEMVFFSYEDALQYVNILKLKLKE